jgi:hypothetical protein
LRAVSGRVMREIRRAAERERQNAERDRRNAERQQRNMPRAPAPPAAPLPPRN